MGLSHNTVKQKLLSAVYHEKIRYILPYNSALPEALSASSAAATITM